MIVFGTVVADDEAYTRYARPGIDRAQEPDSVVLAFAPVNPMARAMNLLLDAAAAHEDLEALVLLGSHTEILDPELLAKVRAALAPDDVALAGFAGSAGSPTLAWWEQPIVCAPIVHSYAEHGGGVLPGFAWAPTSQPPADADALDGSLLVLSPWAVRNLRFDEALRIGHGTDVDLCRQARAAGRRVVVADLRVVLHHDLDLVENVDLWIEAHKHFAEKWDTGLRADVPDEELRARARQAEAERDAERAIAAGRRLVADAELAALDELIARETASLGWRLTLPLRWGNLQRARLAARRRGAG